MYIVEGRPGSIERTAFLFSDELTRAPTTPVHLIRAARSGLAVSTGWLIALVVMFADTLMSAAWAADGLDSPYGVALLFPLPLFGMLCAARVLTDPDNNIGAMIVLVPFHLLMLAPNIGFAMGWTGWSIVRVLLLGSLVLENDSAGAFSVDDDGCSQRRLEPGERCAVRILFAPAEAGVASGVVRVAHGQGTVSVAMSGVGALAQVRER